MMRQRGQDGRREGRPREAQAKVTACQVEMVVDASASAPARASERLSQLGCIDDSAVVRGSGPRRERIARGRHGEVGLPGLWAGPAGVIHLVNRVDQEEVLHIVVSLEL